MAATVSDRVQPGLIGQLQRSCARPLWSVRDYFVSTGPGFVKHALCQARSLVLYLVSDASETFAAVPPATDATLCQNLA
jgi:hypothetical protein